MRYDSVCNTVQEPTVTSTIVAKKTTTWGESGFPSEFLEIIGTNRMDSGPLFDAFGYTPRIQPSLNHSYIHFRCASEHSDLLAQRHRNQWLEWGVGQLEQERTEHRTLMEEITSAIRHINPDAYYEYIEQPQPQPAG